MKSTDYLYVELPRPLDAGAHRQYDTLRLSVLHRHAGINYFTGNRYHAGHALSLTPCAIKNGIMECTLLGADQWTSGFLMPLDDRPRKNPHYIVRAMRTMDDMKERIAEAFIARDGAALGNIAAFMHATCARMPARLVA
jgi:hypothetical protein